MANHGPRARDRARAAPPHEDVEAQTRRRMAEMLRRGGEQAEKIAGGAGLPKVEDAARQGAGAGRDWPEVWGPRVGRALGYAFALYLLWHLLSTYVLK